LADRIQLTFTFHCRLAAEPHLLDDKIALMVEILDQLDEAIIRAIVDLGVVGTVVSVPIILNGITPSGGNMCQRDSGNDGSKRGNNELFHGRSLSDLEDLIFCSAAGNRIGPVQWFNIYLKLAPSSILHLLTFDCAGVI
jgi:hypothetical protein